MQVWLPFPGFLRSFDILSGLASVCKLEPPIYLFYSSDFVRLVGFTNVVNDIE